MNAETLKGHLDLLLLAAVQARPMHGYAIAEALRARSNGAFDLPEGTLYPALHRLERGRLLSSRWSEVNGRRRRVYQLTRAGSQRPREAAWRVARLRAGWSRGGGGTGMRSLPPVEAYLNRLEGELRKHGSIDKRVIEEAREHLLDAIRSGLERGLSIAAAEHEAFSSFGWPETVAAAFAEERKGMNNRLFVLLNSMVSVLRGSQRDADHYHDVGGPYSFHFAVCLKRPWRNRFKKMSAAERDRFIAEMRERGKDVSAFEADPRERLVQFLRDFAGRKFDSSETLESLTLLEDTTDSSKRGGRYLAAFSSGTKMIWSVALTTDGGVSFDGTNAPA